MVLLDYIVELLIHNSETMVVGFLVVLVAYNGWQLYRLKQKSEPEESKEMAKLMQSIENLKNRFQELEVKLLDPEEKELSIIEGEKIKENYRSLQTLQEKCDKLKDGLRETEENLYDRFNEKTNEIKETLKILLTCYRSEKEEVQEVLNNEVQDLLDEEL